MEGGQSASRIVASDIWRAFAATPLFLKESIREGMDSLFKGVNKGDYITLVIYLSPFGTCRVIHSSQGTKYFIFPLIA